MEARRWSEEEKIKLDTDYAAWTFPEEFPQSISKYLFNLQQSKLELSIPGAQARKVE